MDYNKMLMDSAGKGDLDGVIYALERGADVNSRDEDSNTAFVLVAWYGKTYACGSTALILAAANGHAEIAKLLLDAGADLNIKNNDGKTALDLSLEEEYCDIAALIKARVEKQNERQEHAFDLNI